MFLRLVLLSSLLWAEASFAAPNYFFTSGNADLSKELNMRFANSNAKPESLKTRLQVYLRTHGYHLASLEIDKNQVNIKRPIKWELFFEGNTFYTKHLLHQIIEATPLNASIETFASELSQAFSELYKKEGFHFVDVTPKLLSQTKDGLNRRLLFKIDEKKNCKGAKLHLKRQFRRFF